MVDGNKAMIVRYNCTAMYSKYAVVIQHIDGSLSEYYSDAEESKRIKLYISYDEPNEVIFEVPDCNNNWTKIFIYLFDDEKSYYICADSQSVSENGIWNYYAYSKEYHKMKQNVLFLAGLIKEDLPKKILSIEADEKFETLFIEGEIQNYE